MSRVRFLKFWSLAVGAMDAVTGLLPITSLIRALVAVFLIWKISTGAMAPAWGLVAASDGVVALVQIVMLRLGWWKEVRQ